MALLRRKDQEVQRFQLIPEGEKLLLRTVDHEEGESWGRPWTKIEYKVVGGEFDGTKVNGFFDYDLNAENDRSLIWLIDAIDGDLPDEDDEIDIDDYMNKKVLGTIGHSTKQVTDKRTGELVNRTYQNVVDVEAAPISNRERAKTKAVQAAQKQEAPVSNIKRRSPAAPAPAAEDTSAFYADDPDDEEE